MLQPLLDKDTENRIRIQHAKVRGKISTEAGE